MSSLPSMERKWTTPEALRFRIATLAVGATAELSILRNGQEVTVHVNLLPPPDQPPRDTSEIKGRNPFSGAVVANMNPALADELGLESADAGVTIIRLARGQYRQPSAISARRCHSQDQWPSGLIGRQPQASLEPKYRRLGRSTAPGRAGSSLLQIGG